MLDFSIQTDEYENSPEIRKKYFYALQITKGEVVIPRVIARCSVQFYNSTGEGFIADLYVHDQYRTMGVGRQLIREVMQFVETVSPIKVWKCDIHPCNLASKALFESIGFEHLSERHRGYEDIYHCGPFTPR